MADLTCPVGAKLIDGPVADFPELNNERAFCVDPDKVKQAAIDQYLEIHPFAFPEFVAHRKAASPKELEEFFGPDKPAIWISWPEARAYCQAHGGDLPKISQYDKVARGPNGNGNSHIDAGSDIVNDYGVHNMLFNITRTAGYYDYVWEWSLGESQFANGFFKDLRGSSFFYFRSLDFFSASHLDTPEAHEYSGFRCFYPLPDSEK